MAAQPPAQTQGFQFRSRAKPPDISEGVGPFTRRFFPVVSWGEGCFLSADRIPWFAVACVGRKGKRRSSEGGVLLLGANPQKAKDLLRRDGNFGIPVFLPQVRVTKQGIAVFRFAGKKT